MRLTRLKADYFRNLTQLDIELSPQFSIIYGENGSGKSSILEAIHYLSLGRSYRTRLSNRVIQYEQDHFTLFGLVQGENSTTLGIEKYRNGKTRIKIAKKETSNISDLARILPLILINPHSYQLLNEGPKKRRQFLDFGTFHVEPEFFPTWQRFRKILQQRNAALQLNQPLSQIKIWDNEFVELSEILDRGRKNYFQQFKPVFLKFLKEIVNLDSLNLEYYCGWDINFPLLEALHTHIGRERAIGRTLFGPHRADLIFQVNNLPVSDTLSRGEQKLVLYALQIAQSFTLKTLAQKTCIYLFDDLAAELDNSHQKKILSLLLSLESQTIITALALTDIPEILRETPGICLIHLHSGEILEN